MDALGLAWRLAIAVKSPSVNYDKLLAAWMVERKRAVQDALNFVVGNGKKNDESDSFKLFLRDWILWLIQLVPSIRRSIQRPRADPLCYPFEEGVVFLPELEGGRSMSQVFCRILYSNDHEVHFTDDVIFGLG